MLHAVKDTLAEHIQMLLAVADEQRGVTQRRMGHGTLQIAPVALEACSNAGEDALLRSLQILGHPLHIRHHQFGGGARGGGAQVGDEVGDGEIRFMTDSAHHRQRRGGDGARHLFVVEASELLEGAAAARQHDHLHLGDTRRQAQRMHDAGHRLRALHGRGHQHEIASLPAPRADGDESHARLRRSGR